MAAWSTPDILLVPAAVAATMTDAFTAAPAAPVGSPGTASPAAPASPLLATQQLPPGAYAVALWDYAAQRDDELEVKAGEPLWVLEENASGWWLARRANGSHEQGLIPHNYIEKKPEGPPPAAAPAAAAATPAAKPTNPMASLSTSVETSGLGSVSVPAGIAAGTAPARRPPPVVGPSPAALASNQHRVQRPPATLGTPLFFCGPPL